jgi:hypothetical protein
LAISSQALQADQERGIIRAASVSERTGASKVDTDTSRWSGEGSFTQTLLDCLAKLDHVAFLRVEDAPATRSDADYNFISNEVYVAFAATVRPERVRWLGLFPVTRTVAARAMTLSDLERALTAIEDVGPPDYADESMLQYLRTERIVPPYQTRGYKLVELVRVYEAGAEPRR